MEVGEKVMSDPGMQSLLLGWLFEFRVFSFPLKILFVIMWAIPFVRALITVEIGMMKISLHAYGGHAYLLSNVACVFGVTNLFG